MSDNYVINNSITVSIVKELPENAEPNRLYITPDSSSWIRSNDGWDKISDNTISSTSYKPSENKRYFFPTNCVNCGNVLDKEGHCDSCGTYHNPTMVV